MSAAESTERLPWGETLDELAEAVLADRDAPPVLLLAAFAAKHGDDTALREIVGEAIDLHRAETEAADDAALPAEHEQGHR